MSLKYCEHNYPYGSYCPECDVKWLESENAKLRSALEKARDTLQREHQITDETRGGWALKAIEEALKPAPRPITSTSLT